MSVEVHEFLQSVERKAADVQRHHMNGLPGIDFDIPLPRDDWPSRDGSLVGDLLSFLQDACAIGGLLQLRTGFQSKSLQLERFRSKTC